MERLTTTSGRSSEDLICELPLRLPGLNEYIEACRRNKYAANNMKHSYQAQLALFMRRLPSIDYPVKFHFIWVEKDSRRDPDNISFGAKFILDELVILKKLPNDTQKWVKGIYHDYDHGPETKVVMEIRRAK